MLTSMKMDKKLFIYRTDYLEKAMAKSDTTERLHFT